MSGEGGCAREAGVMERRGVCASACTGEGSVWGVYAGGIMAGDLCGEGALSRVFTADGCCSQHPQVCHCAKFE